ncbi:hypothetical protein HB762_27065 (plasmid) [Vibrio campbellii]|uniref:Uncharacterized protein n=1 Tax=Vibrio campbellii TaxID=680 RepID=A0ABY5IMH4_9VIBR|nr:hypothetical protein [Vibrio campbellii]UTZ34926.1 hypothetical protein HB762_27065 [Vibrio campbellii]
MELLGKTARKFGVKSHTVSQNLDEYLASRGKNAAYKDWLFKLNRGDQLPRGKLHFSWVVLLARPFLAL